jgi:hypothetical protein
MPRSKRSPFPDQERNCGKGISRAGGGYQGRSTPSTFFVELVRVDAVLLPAHEPIKPIIIGDYFERCDCLQAPAWQRRTSKLMASWIYGAADSSHFAPTASIFCVRSSLSGSDARTRSHSKASTSASWRITDSCPSSNCSPLSCSPLSQNPIACFVYMKLVLQPRGM